MNIKSVYDTWFQKVLSNLLSYANNKSVPTDENSRYRRKPKKWREHIWVTKTYPTIRPAVEIGTHKNVAISIIYHTSVFKQNSIINH